MLALIQPETPLHPPLSLSHVWHQWQKQHVQCPLRILAELDARPRGAQTADGRINAEPARSGCMLALQSRRIVDANYAYSLSEHAISISFVVCAVLLSYAQGVVELFVDFAAKECRKVGRNVVVVV